MKSSRGAWLVAGLVAGGSGLATSYAVANVMAVRDSPVVAVAELVIRLTPGAVVEGAIGILGAGDKPALVAGILLVLAVLFGWAGRLAARSWWASYAVFSGLGAVGVAAVAVQETPAVTSYLPIAVGYATWLVAISLLGARLRAAQAGTVPAAAAGGQTGVPVPGSRRGFVVGAISVVVVSLGMGGLGRFWGSRRRRVEDARELLRIPGVTEPVLPPDVQIGVRGVSPWQTSASRFYLIHTALALPTIEPQEWRLRIHGLVDRELTLTYRDLLDRQRTEAWITLNCVSNPVGGPLVGNAWWSGVRISDLLEVAGVQDGADAVLQTSEDGWTCGTPLAALTDGRDAMLALAMNGRPLPVEHGFPVRMIVPGLYGFVSACKWLVDLEVTRFDRIEAYWTGKGWAEQAPVRLASRIDVPQSGAEVAAGDVPVGGVAWQQHTGIAGVEVSLDGGDWQHVGIASPPTDNTWVQWGGTVPAGPGDHTLRVRAISRSGEVQTGVEREVVPDGATGWHQVDFTAT